MSATCAAQKHIAPRICEDRMGIEPDTFSTRGRRIANEATQEIISKIKIKIICEQYTKVKKIRKNLYKRKMKIKATSPIHI